MFGSLPVTGMDFAPLLDPLHIGGVAEVVSIAGFPQPTPLTGGFAGPATFRSQTEKLTAGVMNVWSKTSFAAAALALVVLGTHRLPSGKKTRPSNQSKNRPGRREKTKKEEKFYSEAWKKTTPKKTEFSNRQLFSTFIPPLTPGKIRVAVS